MSTHQELRVEYIKSPSKIDCIVPDQQLLRQLTDDVISSDYGGDQSDGAKNDDSSFVPVYKMKVEEAAFTKGDVKLQKVTVTENISDNNNKVDYPIYSEVHGEGINDQTPKNDVKSDEDSETKKPRSRIPKLRQVAEKFAQDKKEEREKMIPTRQPRRSSIPKLKKTKIAESNDTENKPTAVIEKSNKQEKNNMQPVTSNDDKDNLPPEEEFDTMFDEIIQNNEAPVLDTNILVDNFEDAEKLEHSFEEIIHNYEENKIQPINVNEIRSKMPLVKRKSLQKQKFPRELERRLSQDIIIDNNSSDTKPEMIVSDTTTDTNAESTTNELETSKIQNDRTTVIEIKETIEVLASKDHQENVFENYTKKEEIKKEIVKQTDITDFENESVEVTNKPEKDVESLMSIDDSLQNLMSHKMEDTSPTREDNIKNKIKDHPKTSNDINHHKPSRHVFESFDISGEGETTSKQKDMTIEISKYQEKVSQVNNFTADKQGYTLLSEKECNEETPMKNVISEIAVFSKTSVTDNEKEKVSSRQEIKYKASDIIPKKLPTSGIHDSKVVCNEAVCKPENQKCIIMQDTDKILDYANRRLDEENSSKTPECAEKIHRNSLEKLKIETKPTGIPIPAKLRLNLDSVTPPNTPQVQGEPYKDSAHLAGEPKILNEYNECEINKDFASNQSYESHTLNESSTPKHRPHKPHKLSARDVYNQMDYERSPSINFDSPNPDDFDRAPLFEAVNKKMMTKAKNNEFNVHKLPLKGKVSNIINRIDSIDKSIINPPKTETALEIPIKKSVSSRIAMFEHQVLTPEVKTKAKLKQNTKPIIIEEVLKAQPPRHTTPEDESNSFIKNIELKDKFGSDKNENLIVYENVEHIAQVMEVHGITDGNIKEDILPSESYSADTQQSPVKVKENKVIREVIPSSHKADYENKKQEKEERAALVKRVQERLNKEKFVNAERNFNKSKSVAELDLGDAVKGKVHTMIVRMNSVEKLELEKKQDNINIRERPRKKSVSDKIALFEKMLSSVETTATDFENVAISGKAPKTPSEKNTTPKNYQNMFASVTTARANSIDQTSHAATVCNNVALSTTPEILREKKAYNKNVENMIDSVEIAKTTPIATKSKNVATSPAPKLPTETTAPPKNEDYYKQRIEELNGAVLKYGRMENMPRLKLKNGQEMPVLALGTALLDPTLLSHVIEAAIDLGYRAIDTAFIYGNEKEIGEAIRTKINDGTVKREDLFIIGKLWSTFHRRDLVETACNASLDQLGLKYFDLYLVHNPMSFKEGKDPLPKIANVLQYSDFDYLDAWFGMEELVRKGLARSIGVSNFNSEQIARVVDKGKIKPVVNQVECHPYLSQQRLDQFCADRNITLMCFGTLGSKGTPASFKANQDSVIDDPLVRTMAAGLNVTPAELLIKYQIDCGHGVVAKCSSAAHLWTNLQALNLKLGSAEVDALTALNRNKRTYMFQGMGDTHRNYPFKIPF